MKISGVAFNVDSKSNFIGHADISLRQVVPRKLSVGLYSDLDHLMSTCCSEVHSSALT